MRLNEWRVYKNMFKRIGFPLIALLAILILIPAPHAQAAVRVGVGIGFGYPAYPAYGYGYAAPAPAPCGTYDAYGRWIPTACYGGAPSAGYGPSGY